MLHDMSTGNIGYIPVIFLHDIEGHVIVCGASNGLKDLVEQIRYNHSNVLISNGCSKRIPKHFYDPPIVIITPRPNKEVAQVRELPNIYTLFALSLIHI